MSQKNKNTEKTGFEILEKLNNAEKSTEPDDSKILEKLLELLDEIEGSSESVAEIMARTAK
nr:hypothetical protein [Deltaproteobacteria bacterium]